MPKKRHSNSEIASKLTQAERLAKEGKLQSEIAHALGVSVMTLHRWRKSAPKISVTLGVPTVTAWQDEEARLIADLKLENSRLRRLVTDLLLEKMKLEEAQAARRR
jgi:putative transposase